MEPIKLIKKIGYQNGCKVKSAKNRQVLLSEIKESDGDLLISFWRAGMPEEGLKTNPTESFVFKNKVRITNILLSIETAAALHECLEDYFTRIYPNKAENTEK